MIISSLIGTGQNQQNNNSQQIFQSNTDRKNDSIYKVILKQQVSLKSKFKCPDCAETGAKDFIRKTIVQLNELIKSNGKEKVKATEAKKYYEEVLTQNKFETFYFSSSKAIVKILYTKPGMGTVHPINVGKINGKWVGYDKREKGFEVVEPSNEERNNYNIWRNENEKKENEKKMNSSVHKNMIQEIQQRQNAIMDSIKKAKEHELKMNNTIEIIGIFESSWESPEDELSSVVFKSLDGKPLYFKLSNIVENKNVFCNYNLTEEEKTEKSNVGKKYTIYYIPKNNIEGSLGEINLFKEIK